jgi:hypothetical protein
MAVRLGLGPVFWRLWVFSWQSLDLVWVIFAVGLAFLRLGCQEAASGLSFILSGLRV